MSPETNAALRITLLKIGNDQRRFRAMIEEEFGDQATDQDAHVKPLIGGKITGPGILRQVVDLPGIGSEKARCILNGFVAARRTVAKEE